MVNLLKRTGNELRSFLVFTTLTDDGDDITDLCT